MIKRKPNQSSSVMYVTAVYRSISLLHTARQCNTKTRRSPRGNSSNKSQMRSDFDLFYPCLYFLSKSGLLFGKT